MRKTVNRVDLEGRLFSYDLEVKTVQNKESDNFGKEFIKGNLDIAVDEEGSNVITVHYTYEPPTFKSGKSNSKFTALKKIIDGGAKTWSADGKDSATMVKVSSSIVVNDWYNREDELVSSKVIEGGFINFIRALSDNPKNTFRTDMLINGFTVKEADEENNRPEYGVIKGAIFDFRNSLMPVEFTIENEDGINYFLDAEISAKEPLFTQVWGKVEVQKTIVKKVIESAFGPDEVRENEHTYRAYNVTGMKKTPYDFGDDSEDMTPTELKKAVQDREVKLAEEKKKHDDYVASKNSDTSSAVPDGEFNF